MTKSTEWFAEWFNSPYYHTLYKHRDDKEAQLFLTNLLGFLQAPPNALMIDLACGSGRHARFLNQQGFHVTGVDLSENSIQTASAYSSETLQFLVGDLRKLPIRQQFDYAFNLFTSFGYFQNNSENSLVLSEFNRILKPNGILVIDFLNAHKVVKNIGIDSPTVHQTIDGIQFETRKYIENGFICKDIHFLNYHFTERVQAIYFSDFESLMEHAGFEILQVFGNYRLETFDEESSDRFILIAKKHAG